MFNLFGKKKAAPAPQPVEDKSAPYKAFAADFLPEERDILAVTLPSCFMASKDEASGLFRAGAALSAWLDEETPDEVHRDPTAVVALADEELLNLLRKRLPGNFILKFKARLSQDGTRMMLTNLPEPGFDPDLKAILEEQKKPVTFATEDLGEFSLQRAMNCFQTEADWMGQPIQIAFAREEDRDGSLQTARALLADCAQWDEKLQAFLPAHLLERANETLDEDEEALTAEQLLDCLYLESVLVCADGHFSFWFNDGGLFLGNPVHIDGSLSEGLTDAKVEG